MPKRKEKKRKKQRKERRMMKKYEAVHVYSPCNNNIATILLWCKALQHRQGHFCFLLAIHVNLRRQKTNLICKLCNVLGCLGTSNLYVTGNEVVLWYCWLIFCLLCTIYISLIWFTHKVKWCLIKCISIFNTQLKLN